MWMPSTLLSCLTLTLSCLFLLFAGCDRAVAAGAALANKVVPPAQPDTATTTTSIESTSTESPALVPTAPDAKIAVMLIGFFNSESMVVFQPEFIHYAAVDLQEVEDQVGQVLADRGFAIVPTDLLQAAMNAASEEEQELFRTRLDDALRVVDTFLQEQEITDATFRQLRVPLPLTPRPGTVDWQPHDRILLIVGVETFHRAPGAGPHVRRSFSEVGMGLRTALGCFTFAGDGSYRSAVIVPYNFTNFSTQDMITLIQEEFL